MIDFTLTDEQQAMREVAHDFAEREIRPVAWEYDGDSTWPEEVLNKAWEIGLMNALLPVEYGGAGASYIDEVLIAEELAWGDASIATTIGANGLASIPVLLGGNDETKREYLSRLSDGPVVASYALTEPDAGSDVAGIRTTAVRRGDKYVINGSKVFITNGGHADWYTVFAKTDREAGHRGISAFVVPRLAMMTFDRTRPGVAALATGLARAAFEFASDYSKERTQFGVPIAMHQAIQFEIADMATAIEAARLLTWRSAVQLDRGETNTLSSAHAKRFAADAAMQVATEAVQVYGGYGFIKDYPVEKLMRDAKIMQLYEGTSEIQRLVIARETLMPRQPKVVAEPERVAA